MIRFTKKILYAFVLITFLLLLSSNAFAQQSSVSEHSDSIEKEPNENIKNFSEQNQATNILIEYEQPLEELAQHLGKVIDFRLAKYNIYTEQKALSHTSPTWNTNPDWIITLKNVAHKHIIMILDSTDKQLGISEVRTATLDNNIDEMAWTLGLVIEEILVIYLGGKTELPALGAGLAVIEPEIIGGFRLETSPNTPVFPKFSRIGLSLSVEGLWSIKDILVGPNIEVHGLLSPKVLLLFSIGWCGSADYSKNGVDLSISRIPINFLSGFQVIKSSHFELSAWLGTSLGFIVFKSHTDFASRTDMNFLPTIETALEFLGKTDTPLAFFVRGNIGIPLIKDKLVNKGVEIFSLSFAIPSITFGTSLVF